MSEINPREFGKLEAQVEALQEQVSQLSKDVKTLLEMELIPSPFLVLLLVMLLWLCLLA